MDLTSVRGDIYERRIGGVGSAVAARSAELQAGRSFFLEGSQIEMAGYIPALRCLLSSGPIASNFLETTELRGGGNIFTPIQAYVLDPIFGAL